MNRRRLHRSRNGYLMLDLLIVLTLTIVVLSTTSIWVYKTMQYSSDVKQRIAHSRSISRISQQLRTDSRDAGSIAIEDKVILITAGDTSIRYTIESNRLHREVTGGDKVHRDDFGFARNAVLKWMQGSSEQIVLLNIGRDFREMTPGKTETAIRLDSQIRISVRSEASREK